MLGSGWEWLIIISDYFDFTFVSFVLDAFNWIIKKNNFRFMTFDVIWSKNVKLYSKRQSVIQKINILDGPFKILLVDFQLHFHEFFHLKVTISIDFFNYHFKLITWRTVLKIDYIRKWVNQCTGRITHNGIVFWEEQMEQVKAIVFAISIGLCFGFEIVL
jgi:hypothetical protein